jgi:hypothetical protein
MYIHGTPFIRVGTVTKKSDTNRFIENEIEQTDDGRYVWSYDIETGTQINKALLVQHEFYSDGGSSEEVLGGLPFEKRDKSGLDRLLPSLSEIASKLKLEYETFGKIESKAFEDYAAESILDPGLLKALSMGAMVGAGLVIGAILVNLFQR